MQLLHNSASPALWHEIIHEAGTQCDIKLHEELESYLVLLVMHYASKPQIIKDIIATDFLAGLNAPHFQQQQTLKEVGDKCLIFSGLFPKMAEKRLVQISYFVKIGQSSYATISRTRNDLYGNLAKEFVSLMDVLQALRQHSLLPLEAYELWNETGSQRSLNILKKYTKGLPVVSGKN